MIDRSLPAVIETTARQARAASPDRSAWVSANAGSGKTHVLTQRVIRLLIGDPATGRGATSPDKLVCITFTKAAAAEMEARLFSRLSTWALATDDDLRGALEDVVPGGVPTPRLPQIRRLFARALETPGGLKIQTIHAFCERILRRFPAEAGLLPGFEVMDDEVGATAQGQILQELAGQATAGDLALRGLFQAILPRLATDAARGQAFAQLISAAPGLAAAVDAAGGEEAYFHALRAELGVPPKGDPTEWQQSALAGIDRSFLRDLDTHKDLFAAKTVRPKVDALVRVLDVPSDRLAEIFEEVCDAVLNQHWSRPKPPRVAKDKVLKALPDFIRDWEAMIDQLMTAVDAERALTCAQASEAMIRLGLIVHARYGEFKAQRGLLDYNDLIDRTAAVLRTVDGLWVRYKLDQGIDHILLDEAQDTAAAQWSVIEPLYREFFETTPDAEAPRTVFVVGDKKQSIYSFQGADADLFEEKRAVLGKTVPADFNYRDETLFLSFRSAPAVLDFADALFEGESGEGVHGGAPEPHASAHPHAYGRVEVWPLVPRAKVDTEDPWDLPVDAANAADPARVLAGQIADEIIRLVTEERRSHKEVAYGYGDIMVLCQTRGRQFKELIRTLSARGVPTAGADRVSLKADVAVRDLLAALRFAVNQDDDLSLAELLTSPFFDFGDADLFEVCHGRGSRRLWSVLREKAGEAGRLASACDVVVEALDAAIYTGRQSGPFAFFSALLDQGTPSGLKRFRSRLGATSDEAIDEVLTEALQFELREIKSLEAFLYRLENLDTDIKKDAAAKGDVVRLMTVHGAKGLEAPVVFLADASYKEQGRIDALIPLAAEGRVTTRGALIFPAGGKEQDAPAVAAARAEAKRRALEEYRRKLYVAATRAEERLYVCGIQRGAKAKDYEKALTEDPRETDWHALAQQAAARLGPRMIEETVEGASAPRFIFETNTKPPALSLENKQETDEQDDTATAPSWLQNPLPPERPDPIRLPSSEEPSVGGLIEDEGPILPPRRNRERGLNRQARGVLLHHLLEVLPTVRPDARRDVGARLLAQRAPEAAVYQRAAWLDEVMAVLDDPRFADVFCVDAEAEVALHGKLKGATYSGRVDRLLVTQTRVLVVDYKTHRPPPLAPAATPRGIRQQMAVYAGLLRALYPGRQVEAAILWTYAPALVPLPEALLNDALESIA